MAQRLMWWLIAAAILAYLATAVLTAVWFVLTWPPPGDAPVAWLLFGAAYAAFLRLGAGAIKGLITWFVTTWPPPTVFRA